MNAKEAREMVQNLRQLEGETYSQFGDRRQAMGFLDCDAQWKEQVKPLVEALESIECANKYEDEGIDWAQYIATKALSQFRKAQGEE